MKRKILIGIIILSAVTVGVFALIQLVPYGRDHTNPPMVVEPDWDSPNTRQLAVRACFDCHSNETIWPWYSNIAPFSWLVQYDVNQGREKFNFSDWRNNPLAEADELAAVIREGEMPPAQYLLLHPEARLTDAEKSSFIEGFYATISR
jgi:hypothetical protein